MKPNLRRRLRHGLAHLAHHALVASVLALALVVLGHHGWLNWLDSVALRATLEVKDRLRNSSFLTVKQGPESPATVAIGERMYEGLFQQQSPLNRQQLRDLLDQLISHRPELELIVIDLDLSPGPGPAADSGQVELDALLDKIVAQHKIRLVLSAPFPVATPALVQQKFDWMKKRCDSGVIFGYADVAVSQGLALRVDRRLPSLAVVASEKYCGSDAPCQLVQSGRERAAFLSTAFAPELQPTARDFQPQLPIDLQRMRQIVGGAQTLVDEQSLSKPDKLGRRAVFLGASFDPRDFFLTVYGPQPGVVVHAGAYATLLQPPKPLTHIPAFGFDVLLGVAAGLLFRWTWDRYNGSAGGLANEPRVRPLAYCAARAWLVLNFAFLLLSLLFLLSFSAVLLQLNLWMNPGAMIIGVFVKSLLASRVAAAAMHGSTVEDMTATASHEADWASLRVWPWDLLLLSPMILYGIYLLLRP